MAITRVYILRYVTGARPITANSYSAEGSGFPFFFHVVITFKHIGRLVQRRNVKRGESSEHVQLESIVETFAEFVYTMLW